MACWDCYKVDSDIHAKAQSYKLLQSYKMYIVPENLLAFYDWPTGRVYCKL